MKHMYLILKRMLLLFVAFTSMNYVYAQGSTVSGTVTSADDGTPIPGVNVLVQGTTTGTVTDFNGEYNISVEDDVTLVFSSVGFVSEEVLVGDRSVIDVALVQDITSLSEIVVTGYSTEERRDVTGAVATVEPEQLRAIPTGNVEQALQGRVAGVTVITNGQPGTTSVVRVRGFGSFGGNEPLYVVDGVPVGSTNFLQPDDIASTTVLKDAPSASIYGARAANGVIVYTTKKGERGSGKVKISYDGVYGITVPGKVNNILNPQEQADWTWQAIRNTATQLGEEPEFESFQYGTGEQPVLPDYLVVGPNFGVTGNVNLEDHRDLFNVDARNGDIYQVIRANKQGTNWYDEITRPAPIQRHNLSFAGGGENSAYYVSLGLQDQDGTLLHQNLKKYSFRVNSQFDVTDRFRIGENIQTTYYSVTGLTGGSGGRGAAGEENPINMAFRMPSIIPVYGEFGGYAGTRAKGFNNPRNPVALRDRQADNTGYSLQGFGNIYAELDLVDGLTLRSSLGGGYANSYYTSYGPPTYENSENSSSFNYSEGAGTSYNWSFTNTANYSKTFGLHTIDLLAGVEALNTGVFRGINGTGLNPFSRDINYITLTNTQSGGRIVNSN